MKFSKLVVQSTLCPKNVKEIGEFMWIPVMLIETYLVGGFNPSEKYESIGMIIPNWMGK